MKEKDNRKYVAFWSSCNNSPQQADRFRRARFLWTRKQAFGKSNFTLEYTTLEFGVVPLINSLFTQPTNKSLTGKEINYLHYYANTVSQWAPHRQTKISQITQNSCAKNMKRKTVHGKKFSQLVGVKWPDRLLRA